MLRIIEYKGRKYRTGKKVKIGGVRTYYRRIYEDEYRDDYIRFEWDTGFLDMKKYNWDKLSKKMKNRILSIGVGR